MTVQTISSFEVFSFLNEDQYPQKPPITPPPPLPSLKVHHRHHVVRSPEFDTTGPTLMFKWCKWIIRGLDPNWSTNVTLRVQVHLDVFFFFNVTTSLFTLTLIYQGPQTYRSHDLREHSSFLFTFTNLHHKRMKRWMFRMIYVKPFIIHTSGVSIIVPHSLFIHPNDPPHRTSCPFHSPLWTQVKYKVQPKVNNGGQGSPGERQVHNEGIWRSDVFISPKKSTSHSPEGS